MAEPANRKTSSSGGKYYIHPITEEKFDSVTTALDVVGKAALKIWAGMVAADMAFDILPQMTVSMLEPLCNNTFNRCYQKHGRAATCERCPCGKCEKCIWRRIAWRHEAESARRAQEGTEAHEAIKFWVTSGGKEVSLRQEVAPFWASFLQFVADYGLKPEDWLANEITAINREHRYAGTADAVITIRRERSALAAEVCDLVGPLCTEIIVRVDWKSREKGDERLYDDMPMQLVAYDRCTVGMLPNGDEWEVPKADICAIVQLRPGEYSFKPAVTDDVTFSMFLHALSLYRWIGNEGKSAFDLEAVRRSVARRQAANTAIATEVIADVFDAQPVDEDGNIVVELPTIPRDWASAAPTDPIELAPEVAQGPPDLPPEPEFDDPWAPTEFIPVATETVVPAAGSLADLKAHGTANTPAKPPTKKAAKKATPKKSDPFQLAQTGSATLASLKDFDPGRPDPSALGDNIPF